ncbi:MAG: CRTAC1 family protein [Gemmatimonadota bacterium]
MRKTIPEVLGAVLLLAACSRPSVTGRWHDEAGYRWRELAAARTDRAGFTSLAASATGLAFQNVVSEAKAAANRHLMQGAGVAIADVDGDGRPDVYLTRADGPNALFLNQGDWKFTEVAAERGVALGDRASTGAVFADVDGDGDQDLIVGAMNGRNALFLNDGKGHFTDATAGSGFVPEARGTTSLALADVDGDGDLDLYVVNYKGRTMLDSLSPQERAFDQLVKKIGDRYEIIPSRQADYRVVLRPDIRGVSVVQRADPDWFYLNDGHGHFTLEPIAHNPRFLDEDGKPLEAEPEDFGLAARFFDANNDGAPDLYVANDFEDPDQFWLNDGFGRFRLIRREALRSTSNSTMAVDVSDLNGDGFFDLFTVDMMGRDSRRRKMETPTHTPLPKKAGDYSDRTQWQRNALQVSRGDGTYANVANLAGVEASGWSWSALFLDVDLDGYEDLLIGAGHTWDLMDSDTQERLKSTLLEVDWRQERRLYPKLLLDNVAFRNRGDLTFEDATTEWAFSPEPGISHGMALGDLDGDGDLDVVVNRLNAPALLLRNEAGAGRIAVRLVGRAPNVQAVGSRIEVRGGAVPVEIKEVSLGGLYLSSSETLYSFATGRADSVTVAVRWRSGGTTTLRLKADREYEIKDAGTSRAPGAKPEAAASPLFEDVSSLLDHRDGETAFDDFARQPLLPWQLSQLGPGVGWIDLDGDGDDDLVIGAAGGEPLGVFRNDGGRFTRVPVTLDHGRFDLTGVVGLPEGRGARVLVGQSSYRAESPAEAVGVAGVLAADLSGGRDHGTRPAVGGDTTSVGPLALADYDGDGRLDLFVGGRVAPGAYPLPANSRLYRNTAGGFVLDSANTAVLRGVGLVSSAVFTDLDGDGDVDLCLAVEWGPVKVLINDHGRFTDQTAAWGLAGLTGRWNGLAAGDFNGDGAMDLVATSWGRNTGISADSAAPLYMYYGNYGGGGTVQMLLAQADPRLGGRIAPLGTLSRLASVLADVRVRTPTFAVYADAPIEQVLGPAIRQGGRAEARTLDHVVLINRAGRFEPHPLPLMAQIAPAFGVVVADFDGDGREDLFLAQNFSQTDIATPRFDAGVGVELLGDGAGAFKAASVKESGIEMFGDQRGAAVADFDGDGRPDLVVGQNGAETKLYKNRAGKPGLHVRLRGPEENPSGIGAQVRLRYGTAWGPAREIHAGAGYWSEDGSSPLLGAAEAVTGVWVRWPGGRVAEVAVPAEAHEVEVR